MADFVQSNETKNAVRELAAPISDVTTFDDIVQQVISTNPFGCVPYMTAGTTHPGVEKTRERYTARFVYQDTGAATRGNGNHSFDTVAGYNTGIGILNGGVPALDSAHNGTPAHDPADDSFTATVQRDVQPDPGYGPVVLGQCDPRKGRGMGGHCPGPRVNR
jgi:hypothetical protein